MAENTHIQWADHTFNPWIGCTPVSPACDNCYAEAWDRRFHGERWGPHAERTRTKPANWRKPVQWNRAAEGAVERPRVFCASLADFGDNHRSIKPEWRADLWELIRATPNLDWLLLTKRPQNIAKMLPGGWGDGWRNVWLGTTVETQAEWDRRWPYLRGLPAAVRFISAEPLLGPVNLTGSDGLHWVITGGESGANWRFSNPDWFRSLRDQSAEIGAAFLFKQWGGSTQREIKARGRELDGVVHDAYPAAA